MRERLKKNKEEVKKNPRNPIEKERIDNQYTLCIRDSQEEIVASQIKERKEGKAKASEKEARKLKWKDPKPTDLNINRRKVRTRYCSRNMRRLMFRGEILDEVGNSWFTAKSIKVEPWRKERTSKERNKILNKRKSSEKVKKSKRQT